MSAKSTEYCVWVRVAADTMAELTTDSVKRAAVKSAGVTVAEKLQEGFTLSGALKIDTDHVDPLQLTRFFRFAARITPNAA